MAAGAAVVDGAAVGTGAGAGPKVVVPPIALSKFPIVRLPKPGATLVVPEFMTDAMDAGANGLLFIKSCDVPGATLRIDMVKERFLRF